MHVLRICVLGCMFIFKCTFVHFNWLMRQHHLLLILAYVLTVCVCVHFSIVLPIVISLFISFLFAFDAKALAVGLHAILPMNRNVILWLKIFFDFFHFAMSVIDLACLSLAHSTMYIHHSVHPWFSVSFYTITIYRSTFYCWCW